MESTTSNDHRPTAWTRHDALAYLLGRINYERRSDIPYGKREFKLDRMFELARRLGNPQERLEIIHVAGTKGKGSTSTMLAAMLTACGHKTGLFTSPHLVDFAERIVIDGCPIPDDQLVQLVQHLSGVIMQMDAEAVGEGRGWDAVTFFESVTALALLYFAEQQVEFVVLEVGLGGRLDSTNICQPICAIITSIGMDHMRQLGNTLEAIAGEKAGIIKPGVPVVSGVVQPGPREVIGTIANQHGSRLWELGTDFDVQYRPSLFRDGDRCALSEIDFSMSDSVADASHPLASLSAVQLQMPGEHQAKNAALALAAIEVLRELGWNLPPELIRAALAATRCVGRIEIVSTKPVTILDTAHNESSLEALFAAIDSHFAIPRDARTVIFAATRGKDVGRLLRLVLASAKTIVLTRYHQNPRGVPLERLAKMARSLQPNFQPLDLHLAENAQIAWDLAHQLTPTDGLRCITGSFFLASEIRQAVGMASRSDDQR